MSDKRASKTSKGDALVAQATKRLQSWSLFSSKDKYEDAVELYEEGAKQLKFEKEWEKAARTFVDAADLAKQQCKDIPKACSNYTEAAKCFKQLWGALPSGGGSDDSDKEPSSKDAKKKDAKSEAGQNVVKYYTIAVNLHQENNRISQAARLWKEIAQFEEKRASGAKETERHSYITNAIKAWSESANCNELEEATASANAAWLKVAELSAEEEEYSKAIQIYEKVAASAAESSLGKWSVKDYLFKACLCQFVMAAKAGDVKKVEKQLKDYRDKYASFDSSREAKLIEDCMGAFEETDADKFTGFVRAFDKISKLDNWTAKIMLDIKIVLKEGPDVTSSPDDAPDFR